MTVKELIEKLETIENKSQIVVLGVQGYATNDNSEPNKIGVYDNGNGYLFVCDGCYYEEIDG